MELIAPILAFFEASKYALLFVGSFLEGTAVMLTGGVLVQLGETSFWPTYFALLGGDILSDLMWYGIGYFGARGFVNRWGYLINATPENVAKLEERFHRYHTRILVISKLTMGFGLAAAILATAGMLRVSLLRYTAINVICGFIWVFLIMIIGYYFGNVLALVPKEFQFLMVGIVLVAFVVFFQWLSKKLATVNW
jgi:membrane protein DedA with SNARE-associated domain